MSAAQQPMDLPPKRQRIGAAAATTLTIPRRTGHRRVLRDYFVTDGASGFSDIRVGNATLMRIFDNLAQAILISNLNHRVAGMGFLEYWKSKYPDLPYFNAGQDEDIIFTRDSTADRLDAYWEDVDKGDVTSRNLPGGSQGKKWPFILNMSNAADITVTATGIPLTRQDMPAGLTLFTDGTRMSANNRFHLHAVAGNFPLNVASVTNRVHIFDEFTELFTSENNEGLFVNFTTGSELLFDMNPLSGFWLPEPHVFEPNKVVDMRIDCTIAGGNNLLAGTQQLFLIGMREYVGMGGA